MGIAKNTPTEGQVKGKVEEIRTDASKAMDNAAGKAEEVRQDANQSLGQAADKARDLKNEASRKAQQ